MLLRLLHSNFLWICRIPPNYWHRQFLTLPSCCGKILPTLLNYWGKISPTLPSYCSKAWNKPIATAARLRKNSKSCHNCESRFVGRIMLSIDISSIFQNKVPYITVFQLDRNYKISEKYKFVFQMLRPIYTCDFCEKGFPLLKDLTKHRYTHTGEKPYICLHCDYRSTQSSNLKRHMKKYHPENTSWLEQKCCRFTEKEGFEFHGTNAIIVRNCSSSHRIAKLTWGFTRAKNLTRVFTAIIDPCKNPIWKRIWEKNTIATSTKIKVELLLQIMHLLKENECEFCGKIIKKKSDLKKHRYTHTGERPFPCPECPYRANQSSALKSHLRSQHNYQWNIENKGWFLH